MRRPLHKEKKKSKDSKDYSYNVVVHFIWLKCNFFDLLAASNSENYLRIKNHKIKTDILWYHQVKSIYKVHYLHHQDVLNEYESCLHFQELLMKTTVYLQQIILNESTYKIKKLHFF